MSGISAALAEAVTDAGLVATAKAGVVVVGRCSSGQLLFQNWWVTPLGRWPN